MRQAFLSSVLLDKNFDRVYHSNMHLNELAKLMRTVGDESRLKILCFIFNHKKFCVSAIALELDMSVAIASHHLKVMAKLGLIAPVREGKRICHKLPKDDFMRDLKKFVCKYK
jgi:DNA-binding transcriptional ArsR family regulator